MSSKIFKAGNVKPSNEAKIIEAKPFSFKNNDFDNEVDTDGDNNEEIVSDNRVNIPKEVQEMIVSANKEADEIVQLAHEQALEIRQMADQEKLMMEKELEEQASLLFESSKEDGYNTGYQDGYAAGDKQAYENYNHRIVEINQILLDAHNSKIEELMEAQNLIINLSYEIACKVVLNNPDLLKDQIVELVVKSLEKVRDTEKVEINVNPNDFAIVNEALPMLKSLMAGKAEVIIQIESHIESGSCQLLTSKGTVDATITTQLEEIKKALQTLDIGREGLVKA